MVKEKSGRSFRTRPSQFVKIRKISLARQVQLVRIISPDDPDIKLTETMKKECENKTIYYNSEVQIVEDFKADEIQTLDSEEQTRHLHRLFSKFDAANERTSRSPCLNVKVSEFIPFYCYFIF